MSRLERITPVRLTPQLDNAVEAFRIGTPLSRSDVMRMALENYFAPFMVRAQINADVAGQVKHASETVRAA